MRGISIFSSSLAILLSLQLAQTAQAWGRYGHEVTGHVAMLELDPQAAVAVAELLDGRSLADVAVWADDVRPDRGETAPLHYINAPRGVLRPRGEDFALPQGNVYSAVVGYAGVLADETRPLPERREALKFFVHFVGDLHQPLHTGFGDDRGANDFAVLYRGEPSSLHRYWDTQILDDYAKRYSSKQLAAVLHHRYKEHHDDWRMLDDPVEWVEEARSYIFRGIYPMTRSDQAHPEIDSEFAVIDSEYRTVWLPVAEKQLLRSGLRMAKALNQLFEEGQSPFQPAPIEFPPRPD